MTLLVLAAGMGSRYGGIKQMDPMGPCGEFVLDYSVYDALRAGFTRAVFVIRRELEADFRERVLRRFGDRLQTDLVFQQDADLPAGWSAPAGRAKPWGTGHAVWVARHAVTTPFLAINADDFYGRDAFAEMAAFFKRGATDDTAFAMAGYRLENTLSEHGAVSRGICAVDAAGMLGSVTEFTGIARTADGGLQAEGDPPTPLTGGETVSMNFWGLKPSVFALLEAEFQCFLENSAADARAEFYLPNAISAAVGAGSASVRVLPAAERWFGVTYPRDKETTVRAITERIADGIYPQTLWK